MIIPLHKPFFDAAEAKAVASAVSKFQVSGDGFYGRGLRKALESRLRVKYALPTPSGTAALELAVMALGLKTGDEVVMPSFNYPSGATAVMRVGAKPVFADINRETFCISPASIKKFLTPKTKAIMVVHYAGQACLMDKIMALAAAHGCAIIEDASHAIGARHKTRFLGTVGDVGCFSFHGTKNLTVGEGGAFVTNNENLFKRAELIREKGTNKPAFMRGEVSEYRWVGQGSSFLLADVLSALALVQLKKLNKITSLRRKHAAYLLKHLADLRPLLKLPMVKKYAHSCWHIFAVLVESKLRDNLIGFLRKNGIEAAFHYLPLHSSPMGLKLVPHPSSLPHTDFVSRRLIRLPIYPSLSKKELDYMIDKLHEFFKQNYQ